MGQRTYYRKQVLRVEGVSNELERGGGGDWRGDREMNIAMMREHVEGRREDLAALRDTLITVVGSLAPVRYSAKPEPSDFGDEEVMAAADIGGAEPSANSKEAQDAGTDSLQSAGEETFETAAQETAARVRDLRRRFRPNRESRWPPEGDPVAFAAQTRSQLERLASRFELQRREMNRYTVEIEKKFAIPVAAIVFVLIGAPVAVRFPHGGIGMVIGVSLSVFCVYYIFLIGGEDFADRGFMSPFWAMWAPNVIFSAVGVTLLYFVTRRGTKRRYRLVEAVKRTLHLGEGG